MWKPVLPVALPLLMAAVLAAVNRRVPRAVATAFGIAAAVFTAGVCLSLVSGSRLEHIVYWFGGWAPRQGLALGVVFVIDGIGAGLAALVSVLVAAALVFSSRYFDTVGTIYHALMMAFLGAMCGFCLTGDLFNLFVFFELMSAAAFALCGYKSEEPGPLQGALNFAVINTLGAFLVLTGIALLYGRTGALNMAQIGRALAGADGLVATAFTFLMVGLLTKAAVVPMHFWLADAHAVAPTPVCILFSGVMVELGVYGAARVYWTMFSGVLAPHEVALRNILVGAGAMTALTGAVLCYAQRHIKRLLAFSTVSHVGLMLAGFGLLTPEGLAGSAVYVLGHGMVKGALFMCAGIVLHRTGSVDELELRDRCCHMRGTGALFALAALGLAGLPPFATFLGESAMSHAAESLGYGWLSLVSLTASAITAGAVFRVIGRVFYGWGPRSEAMSAPGSAIPETPETTGGHARTPASMTAPGAVLAAFGLLLGIAPGLPEAAHTAAEFFVDRPAYAARVLDHLTAPLPDPKPRHTGGAAFAHGAGAAALALVLAGVTLFGGRAREVFSRSLRAPVRLLRAAHSGVVGDYTVWLTAGVVAFGGLAALFLRD